MSLSPYPGWGWTDEGGDQQENNLARNSPGCQFLESLLSPPRKRFIMDEL